MHLCMFKCNYACVFILLESNTASLTKIFSHVTIALFGILYKTFFIVEWLSTHTLYYTSHCIHIATWTEIVFLKHDFTILIKIMF